MTKQIRIVALLGSASSGKSTVAQYLVKHHGFVRVRFAQPLKDMLKTLGLSDEEVDGALKEVPCNLLLGKTPRLAQQTLGTEWRDYIGKALWARITRKRITDMHAALRPFDKPLLIVIDDMRFGHEPGELVHPDWELTTLAIRRPEVEPSRAARTLALLPIPNFVRAILHLTFGIKPLHRSEAEWFKIARDADIPNEGTIADLRRLVDKATMRARI